MKHPFHPICMPLMERHENFCTWLRFKRRDVKTALQQIMYRNILGTVEKHCVFIGYPRSGHTLVAALLDAHPNIVISKGVDPLQYMERGFGLSQIYVLYLIQARRFARKGGKSNGYSYLVPNQWNGRFDQLNIIGDKSGDLLSEKLLAKPKLLDRLLSEYRAEHKFIHVIRNPFDNIATISTRNEISLEAAISHYFSLCGQVARARTKVPRNDWVDVWLEDIIAEPKIHLVQLCQFLGQGVSGGYLDDCASIVFESPRQSRFSVPWTPRLIARVATESAKYSWLSNYRFESPMPFRPAQALHMPLQLNN